MPVLTAPSADRQVGFHALLVGARNTVLIDALSDALSRVDPIQLRSELSAYVPADVARLLAKAGIRDEHVFPVPVILRDKPSLVGYYRLLLGAPQKRFYKSGTGMSAFKGMEVRGTLSESQSARLDQFCAAMAVSLADMVRRVSPALTQRDVAELPLITLGAQFQGANNNIIGQKALEDVFMAVRDIVHAAIVEETSRALTVRNAAGRTVLITFASDPDIRIQEVFGENVQNRVAIEIKGGTDLSNAHNRAGEAEKSHQKARGQGFRDFWTLITMKGLDSGQLRRESQTTNSWFDVAEVLARQGPSWEEFRERLAGQVGIPLEAGKPSGTMRVAEQTIPYGTPLSETDLKRPT